MTRKELAQQALDILKGENEQLYNTLSWYIGCSEKENQELKEWCLILNKHLYIAPEMCELRMATPKNADFLIKNSGWTKYYNGIDVHEIDYKKFVDLYYSKIKEVLE